MRIFLLLAAAGAAAIATSAPARPAGKPGHGAAAPGAWAPDGRHGARSGWQGRVERGRRHGRSGRPGRGGPYYYDGFGIGGPGAIVAPWGNGFFAGGGGEVWMKGDRPHYDYDRAYPYEFASRAGERPDWEEEARPPEPRPRCTLEHGVRVCRGW